MCFARQQHAAFTALQHHEHDFVSIHHTLEANPSGEVAFVMAQCDWTCWRKRVAGKRGHWRCHVKWLLLVCGRPCGQSMSQCHWDLRGLGGSACVALPLVSGSRNMAHIFFARVEPPFMQEVHRSACAIFCRVSIMKGGQALKNPRP